MSRDRRPAVRAISVHDALTFLDKFQPGATHRVRAAIPGDVLAIIDATPRLGWVDVDDDVYVPSAIWSVLGDEDATEMILEFLESHLHIPLISPLIEGTRKLFGLTPLSVLRALPTGWKLIYRDFGKLSVRPGKHRAAEILLSDLPRTVIGSDAYLATFRAHFLGLIRLTDRAGEAHIAEIDRVAGRVRYELSWR